MVMVCVELCRGDVAKGIPEIQYIHKVRDIWYVKESTNSVKLNLKLL